VKFRKDQGEGPRRVLTKKACFLYEDDLGRRVDGVAKRDEVRDLAD